MSIGGAERSRTPRSVPTGRAYPSFRPRLDLADFALRFATRPTPEACAAHFSGAIRPFGFDSFTCGEYDPSEHDRTVVHVGHWPGDRPRLHAEPATLARDPIVRELAVRTTAFTWSDLRDEARSSVPVRRALSSAAAAGWHEGLLVPIPQASGRVGFVSLAGTAPCPDRATRDTLVLMSLHLHHHVRTLVGTHGFAVQPLGLTEREVDVIRLAARGLSDAAIGRELGIAASTAHEHVEKAKRKMRVRSRTELAALAVSLGIISL